MTQPQHSQLCPQAEDFRQSWDTSSVTDKQRFSYFREGVCQAFLSFTPEEPPDRRIEARIATAQVSGGLISKISVTPHRVARTRADVANIEGEFLSLGFQSTGGIDGDLHGKPFSQKAGDISLVNANNIRGFELDPRERYTTTALLFETSRLEILPDLDKLYFLAPAYLAPIKLCLSLINDVYDSASRLELTHLFDATLSLLQASLAQDKEFLEDRCLSDPAIRSGMLRTIQAFVRETIADPGLSTIAIANHFGISPRYVQKLFADDGTTLKSFITAARLSKVQADLLDPTLTHIPAGDIAWRWGFRDTTTFHRNFKLRFGDTPNQMRGRRQNWRI